MSTTATTMNTTQIAIGAAGGAAVGFAVAHFSKLGAKKHWTIGLIVAGAVLGGVIGQYVPATTTVAATTPAPAATPPAVV